MSKQRRKHYRVINHRPQGAENNFSIACGTDVHWTSHTTSNKELVTCKRCLAYIKKTVKTVS